MINAVKLFLESAARLAKMGVKKEGIERFAKEEFGEISEFLQAQINNIFRKKKEGILSVEKRKPIDIDKDGNVIEVSFKPGKDKRGKVVEESPSQESGIMERIQGAANKLRQLQKEQEAMFKPFDVAKGLTRTIARRILDNKKVQIGKKDPIDVYQDIFGEQISDVRNLADELVELDRAGGGTKSLDEMIKKEGLFDVEIPTSPRRGMSDEEFRKFLQDKGVDPDTFADGGRVKYAYGSGIKFAKFLAIRGKTLKDEIKKAIDNFIQPSGDRKLDADVILDDMLEELGTSRGEIDEKDLLDAYGEIYDTITKPRSFKGVEIKDPKFDENMPFDNDAEKLAEIKMSNEAFDLEGVDPRDTILPMADDFDLEKGLDDLDNLRVTKDSVAAKKALDEAKQLTPKMIERFELKRKFPGIDDETLNAILDMDMDKKASMMADMEMGMKLLDEGKGVDEVKDILEKGVKTRKDNAKGGLNYLMGM